MPNALTTNCWLSATYLPVLFDVDTSCVTGGVGKCSGKLGGEGGVTFGGGQSIEQDIIPYVGQLKFANVPIEG